MSQNSCWKIERKKVCMHVTAVKILGQFLFVDGQSKVLFFGSKSLRIYSFDSTSVICLKSCSDEILLFDWIFDVQWLIGSEKKSNIVAVITAHNCLTILNINNKRKLKTIQCVENCILYAANIISASESFLLIAVGTVFRQILLWSPNSASKISEVKVPPLHCLEGHKGVIFSVSYNKCHRLLSSTSDDRSIRLWKVNSLSDDDSSIDFWENADICPSHVLNAHESRVWTSVILENCILSVGEDSFICFWNLNGELLKRKKCHKGGSIWCLETNDLVTKCSEIDSLDSHIAITGGSDGGVYCWSLKSILSKDLVSLISLHIRSSPEKDFPRVVSILNCSDSLQLMTTTDNGWLSFYDIAMKSWKDVYRDSSYASYCIPSVSSRYTCIALGNLSGDLVLINNSNGDFSDKNHFKKFKIHSGKVQALHWVSETNDHLLSCGVEGFMILWEVHIQDKEFSINKLCEYHLPKCKPHWWSTCALYVNSSTSLIVGDRGGSINFYSPDTEYHKTFVPDMIHKCIHGENGVTDIQEHQSLIYSAGRDGRVLLYSMKKKSLKLLHAIKISHDLEWIGRILFCASDLLLLGFHTKYFIVWSTALESTVMTVECGGGHRSWDFHLTEDGQATFTAIKKKDIMFYTENLNFTLNNSVIKAGISGKEFCTVCYLFNHNSSDSGSMAVLAAGGEDNALRIIGCFGDNSESSQMVTLYSLSGHLSNIRSLTKTNMSEKNTYLLASVGSRAQMMLWKIKNDLNIVCEQLASYILSSLERQNKKTMKGSQDAQVDPQTRIMDVNIRLNSANHYNEENYIIALACSDSCFRVYNFDASKRVLSLLYNVQLSEHCILKLIYIEDSRELFNNIFYITATTSGHLNFVSHENLQYVNAVQSANFGLKECISEPQFQVHMHQSGINAIDIKHISGNTWLICTGGDDNALSAVIIEVHPSLTNCEIVTKTQVLSAHSSQITGVKIIEENVVISISIDQRINLWKWCFDGISLSLSMKASKILLIPDIANIECWKTENTWIAVVCGEGIEMLTIENVN